MKKPLLLFFLSLFCVAFLRDDRKDAPVSTVRFRFKERNFALAHPMGLDTTRILRRLSKTEAELDTLSSVFYPETHSVEIIRQDDTRKPLVGIALTFEFDEENGEYPYTPARTVVQLKDFRYGGVEFDRKDTLNYTGVSNEVSDDVTLEVTSFENDTIAGRFSGLLLNGAGKMAALEDGFFKIRLFRK